MIGRGVLGNPWLIKETVDYLETSKEPVKITLHEKITMIKKHLKLLAELKNEKMALLEIRSHIAWYLKGVKGANEIKKSIFKITDMDQILTILDSFEEKYNEENI
ncbi:MAG: tRNA-dihydrouridine synthase, partial [Bacilli bacterium]|nr:tRNA-dihydrouridine synthase [Bacilli bacterium]